MWDVRYYLGTTNLGLKDPEGVGGGGVGGESLTLLEKEKFKNCFA